MPDNITRNKLIKNSKSLAPKPIERDFESFIKFANLRVKDGIVALHRQVEHYYTSDSL